jgi:FKBP-type peptidyl-prolyl cis-trans isomerase (trigger factor)
MRAPQLGHHAIGQRQDSGLEELRFADRDRAALKVNVTQVEAGKFDQAAAFSYKARFEVTPEIAEVSYEGLELTRPSLVVGEEQVVEQLVGYRPKDAIAQALNKHIG